MLGLTPAHLLILLVIALIVVGPGKLPEVGGAIGKSVREFQKAVNPVQDAVSGAVSPVPAQGTSASVTQTYAAAQSGYVAPAHAVPPPASSPAISEANPQASGSTDVG